MIKKISGLLFARAVTLMLLLLFNFLLVKYLTMEEVGVYYLIVTVSYLGNAIIYVGADLVLQKNIAKDIQSGILNKKSLIEYICKTSWIGSSLVLIFSSLVFYFSSAKFFESVLVCTFLTTLTYITSLFRNLYQTAAKPFASSFIQLLDTIIKVIAILFCIMFDELNSQYLFLCYLTLSIILLFFLMRYFLLNHVDGSINEYFESYLELARKILPIGSAGLLNWGQLQSYRPFLSLSQQNFSALGVISFLTNLGSTATNAILTVISQLFLPKIYSSQGKDSKKYLYLIALVGGGLAIISMPCGWIFLTLANKEEMISVLYLIPVGVLQETINSMIGAMTVHYTVKSRPLTIFPICTFLGLAFMSVALLLNDILGDDVLFIIAVSLLFSQVIVILSILLMSIRNQVFVNVE